jgi:hypothetical protein
MEVVDEAFPPLASDEIAVRVALSLLDPSSLTASEGGDSPEVSFAGVISEVGPAISDRARVGQPAIGVGPLADLISLPEREVRCVLADFDLSVEQAVTIPYLCSFLHVLSTIRVKSDSRILITGQPIIRHLSVQFLKVLFPDISRTQIQALPSHIATELDGPFDVLIHGVTDPADLQLSLSTLGEGGQAFLLVPPGRHVLPLDFYPHVHRSCLRLVIHRVGEPCRPASCPDPGHARLSQLFEEELIDVSPVLSHVSGPSELAGLSLDGVNRSQKLLAVAWP